MSIGSLSRRAALAALGACALAGLGGCAPTSRTRISSPSRLLMAAAVAALAGGTPAAADDLTPQEAQKIGVDAYIYGYPLITSDVNRRSVRQRQSARPGNLPGAVEHCRKNSNSCH